MSNLVQFSSKKCFRGTVKPLGQKKGGLIRQVTLITGSIHMKFSLIKQEKLEMWMHVLY
jgi:hypothetical protein